MQHAISVEALQYLESETDAKGRRLEVLKMPCPPPLHISEEEAAGVAKVDGSKPRQVSAVSPQLPSWQLRSASGDAWIMHRVAGRWLIPHLSPS